MPVRTEPRGSTLIVTLDRPEARNAVDGPTAAELVAAFTRFDQDDALKVAILTGAHGVFCAGADLKALGTDRQNRLAADGAGPMGPTRMLLSKPVIAAIEGYAVAGGLELAVWCDLRVAARSATFGVFCRRWGVPLIDGGTVRLARCIGMSRALDLILTGRAVNADEAQQMGLANRVTDDGNALQGALELAGQLAAFPQECMRNDRLSAYEQWSLPIDQALANEFRRGQDSLSHAAQGVQSFKGGAGRHGKF